MAGDSCKACTPSTKLRLIKETGAIDDVHRAVSETKEESKRAEGKKIVEELAKLKYELQHDRKLTYGLLPSVNSSLTEPGPSSMMDNRMLKDITRSSRL